MVCSLLCCCYPSFAMSKLQIRLNTLTRRATNSTFIFVICLVQNQKYFRFLILHRSFHLAFYSVLVFFSSVLLAFSVRNLFLSVFIVTYWGTFHKTAALLFAIHTECREKNERSWFTNTVCLGSWCCRLCHKMFWIESEARQWNE